MTLRLRMWMLSGLGVVLAACAEHDDLVQMNQPSGAQDAQVGGSADAAVAPGAPGAAEAGAGQRVDAGPAACAATDPIGQLFCQLGAGGAGGLEGLLGGLEGLLGGGAGMTMPTAAQCRNPTDQRTRMLCGLRVDAGTGLGGGIIGRVDAGNRFPPVERRDASVVPPVVRDASVAPPVVAVDAGTPEVDAGTPEVDAGTPEVDASTPEVDASTPEVDAGIL